MVTKKKTPPPKTVDLAVGHEKVGELTITYDKGMTAVLQPSPLSSALYELAALDQLDHIQLGPSFIPAVRQ